MKKIGLTGGIGSGKSIIGKILSIIGFPVFYSDAIGKMLMTEDQSVVSKVKELFGSDAYIKGKLNRTYISEKVFKNPNLKEKLNQIVHPAVRKNFDNWCSQQVTPLVFNEAAILFETGSYKNFDALILVTADEKTRINRVMKRDQVSKQQVLERINNQWSDDKKKKLADFIISNDDNDLLIPQVESIVKQLLNQ
ncbi:MAG: dephospho-CoA kinase [Brumimicrobium sp.]